MTTIDMPQPNDEAANVQYEELKHSDVPNHSLTAYNDVVWVGCGEVVDLDNEGEMTNINKGNLIESIAGNSASKKMIFHIISRIRELLKYIFQI